MKYYTIYKITNLTNKYLYIGAHITTNVNDNYLGSSKHLRKDIKLLGKDSFYKEILFIFLSKEEMLNKEAELVNKEFCYRTDTYNRMVGGIKGSFNYIGMITVKDKDNCNLKVYLDDPRYLSGELVSISKGKVTVKNKDGETSRVNTDDPRYLSGELIFEKKGTVNVRDKYNNVFNVNINDERYISGELPFINKGKVTVKDKSGNTFNVDKNDPRYLSGELEHNLINTIVVKDSNGNRFCVNKNDPRYLSGELVGWAKGRVGIKGMLGKHRTDEEKEKLSKLASLRVGKKSSGYGRSYINNGEINKRVLLSELETYLSEGWIKGRKKYKHGKTN